MSNTEILTAATALPEQGQIVSIHGLCGGPLRVSEVQSFGSSLYIRLVDSDDCKIGIGSEKRDFKYEVLPSDTPLGPCGVCENH
ncbi:MAG: hypothetical protein OXG34_01565 [bacterium]|nr:hypothetical protein [bacterium]MCY3890761.1 hypothetical protein [bacterium]MCY3960343.1 hypothetical protein [bacterium]